MVETDIRRTRTCEKCKAIIPFDRVRLFPKNPEKPGVNMVVCDVCCEQLKKGFKGNLSTLSVSKDGTISVKKPNISAAPEAPKPVAKPARVVSDNPDATHYLCTRCNYKFRFDDDGVTSLRCPYCGKPDKLNKQ